MSELRINLARLRDDLESLSHIGRQADHGIYRMAFTAADLEARHWLRGRLTEAGLEHTVDGVMNVFGRYSPAQHRDLPAVMTGSHLDTVPGAGHLDGALGVVAALECLRCLSEQKIALARPVEMVAFSDEEGRFGGVLGSQALCGQLSPESVLNARDIDGVTLQEAMAHQGLNSNDVLGARRSPETIHAFVELHIEQGPILDRQQITIGEVEAFAGLFRWNVRLIGSANHAGTTPMNLRQDAFQGLAEFAAQLPRLLEEEGGSRSVATIGRVQLSPGAANVVPGQAEFSLEVRDADEELLAQLSLAMRRTLSAIARRRQLMFEYEVHSEIAPVRCDTGVVQTIADVSRELNLKSMPMVSGAIHDAQIIASVARTGMIFVPSREGRSHSAAEWTAYEDIEAGTNVLLNTLYRLAR